VTRIAALPRVIAHRGAGLADRVDYAADGAHYETLSADVA
jgi:hypothetical protein